MKKPYKVCAFFDTETTNIGEGRDTRAFVACYQLNDMRFKNLRDYVPGVSDEVSIYRTLEETENHLDGLVTFGFENNLVPVVCGYNLMFDLETLRCWVSKFEKVDVNAQSSTNVYTIDVCKGDGTPLLRFWDTYHLEITGLSSMGRVAGLEKLEGDWDYTKIRTPETPLTKDESGYATRDVQVMPAYLRWVLETNPYLDESDLGSRVLTKSSLVRQMALHEIYPLNICSRNGRVYKAGTLFEGLCKREMAPDFEAYALRKCCFRGGLTFTAAANASKVLGRIASFDVTSMHHLFINGRYVPQGFKSCSKWVLQKCCENIIQTPLDKVLENYHRPFPNAVHVKARFKNMHLKEGSVFERFGIATLATAKFVLSNDVLAESGDNPKAYQEKLVYESGYHDSAQGAVCAFGKVMGAQVAEVYLNEIELYLTSLVYDFDEFEVLGGEVAMKAFTPPEYVSLQSNILFKRKNDMKKVVKAYREGEPLPFPCPDSIPESIKIMLEDGSATEDFIKGYYVSNVKGSFNGIYGTQAQDVMKPGFCWSDDEVHIDQEEKTTVESYNRRLPEKNRVLYTYGMRIVAGSRLHLAISMVLIFERFGDRVQFLGGDTDSLKISLAEDITPEDILETLEPLHAAARNAIEKCQRPIRNRFPGFASSLENVGEFDFEATDGEGGLYDLGMEAWNKCRILVCDGKNHITCAGVARPANTLNLETFADALLENGVPFEEYAPKILGYNMFIPPEISHSLEKHRSKPGERFIGHVTDYLGIKQFVDLPQAVALYPAGRLIGDTLKSTNARNVRYLSIVEGREVDTRPKTLCYNPKPEVSHLEL